MPDPKIVAPFPPRPSRPRIRLPSLNFLLLLLIFAGSGALLWHGMVGGRFFVFVFVVAGWVVSLCLHEFGHALVAYFGGDLAVARTGYLDLDPMRYTDPVLSIILPLAYVVLGGFGLPGGAVFINIGQLRSRGWIAAVSAAGPTTNVLFLLGLAALYRALLAADGAADLAAGVGVLALFQATAIVLNLLPIPGLDGFGILAPFLPARTAARVNGIGGAAFLILFLLLWLTSAGALLLRAGLEITAALGIDTAAVAMGFGQLKLF